MKILSALILWALVNSALAQQGYICVADKASGFTFNKATNTWEHARFNVADQKYILSVSQGAWTWKKLGEQSAGKCGSFSEYGYLNCETFGSRIYFNNRNLRYISYYLVGYVSGGISDSPEGSDTPSVEIGRCTQM